MFMDDNLISEYIEESVVRFTDPELKGVYGTADFIGVSEDGKTVFVLDFKFGHKIVSPVENAQGLFYGAAAYQDPSTSDLFDKCETVVIGIIQPTNDESCITSWETTPARLDSFVYELKKALKESESDEARVAEGKECTFCPAKAATCPLKHKQVMSLDNVNVTPANLTQILEIADSVEAVVKEAKKLAQTLLENGTPVMGWKLVPKRATRKWVGDGAEEICKKSRALKAEDYYTQTLKSPAQMEKICKVKKFDFDKLTKYIESVSSGHTLAREDDKRQGITKLNGRDVPEQFITLAKQHNSH